MSVSWNGPSIITPASGSAHSINYELDTNQNNAYTGHTSRTYEHPASQQNPTAGITFYYNATTAKQYINVNIVGNTTAPDYVVNTTTNTGGSGISEIEYTTGDVIQTWSASYSGAPLCIFTTTSAMNFVVASGPTVNYGPSHGALPTSTGFTVHNLNFRKMGDREYRISYQQKNAPPSSYTVRVEHTKASGAMGITDFTVTTAASGQTINLESGSLYGTGPGAADSTPQNNTDIHIRFMDFNAKLGTSGSTISQGLIFNTWTYLYNNLSATFTPSNGVPGTIFTFTLTGSDDSYASSNTATLTDPSGTVTTFTKNAYGQFLDDVTNVTSIEGDYTVEHPTGVNRGTSTFNNSGPPIVETTSDGGGKRRRYPIISTNLFDRQRSIFSIGLTHKDETLF